MTVRANKPAFNIREKLKELTHSVGLKGRELMRAATVQDARDLISAGRRNLIINGAMTVHQRGSNLTSGGFIADRWAFDTSSLDQWAGDVTWETDAPAGFSRSIKMNTTTAETSFEAGDELSFQYRIEAQDLQHLDWGTANAKSLTLSFWVKCNKTGTQSIHVRAHDAGDGYSTSYSINSADTWEYKTIVIPGNTAGSINNDTGIGIWIRWVAADGDTAVTEDAWDTSNTGPYAVSGAMDFGTTIGDYLQIAGVQLEVGRNATEFEHRSYGEELALCQRYFWSLTNNFNNSWNPLTWGHGGSANRVFTNIVSPVEMRVFPSIYNKQVNVQDGGTTSDVTDRLYPAGGTAYIIEYGGFDEKTHLALEITAGSTTDGNGYRVNVKNVSGTAGYIYFDAEL